VKFLLDHDVPDDLSYLLEELNHEVMLLRKSLPGNSSDEAVLTPAVVGYWLATGTNFLHLVTTRPHHGVVIIIRRRTRADERAALFRLLERAGEAGLVNNVNFA
jgi:hypothetical protein